MSSFEHERNDQIGSDLPSKGSFSFGIRCSVQSRGIFYGADRIRGRCPDCGYGAASGASHATHRAASGATYGTHGTARGTANRTHGFSRSDFRYDPTYDVYHCPGGKQLRTSGTVHEGKTLLYLASKLDCDLCALKPQCCPKEPSRNIPSDIHERARDVARSFADIEGFEQSRRERKKIEMRFAHLKRILRLGRLRLRGPRGAQDEFVLAAIAQNLRRLAKLVARPPPYAIQCVA